MSTIKEPIQHIDIATGGTCNLRCSYCFLHDLASHKDLDTQIKQALQDGSYANTCVKVLQADGNNPLDITTIGCWGGESTLHLPVLIESLHYWKTAFPNLEVWSFITNGSYKAQDMFDFLLKMDELGINVLEIQTSLDGPQEVNDARGISVEKILSTLCDLIDLLNTVKLKNTKLNLTFKSTTWVTTYNQIHQTKESATKYYKFWADEVIARLESHKNNLNMIGLLGVSPLDIAYQFDYTQQDGLNFAHSLRVYNSLDWEDIGKNVPKEYPPLQDFLSYFIHFTRYTENSIRLTSHNYYCGAYTHGRFIRVDGAVLGCLGSLFADNEQFLNQIKVTEPLEYNLFKNTNKHFIYKPLEMSKEEQKTFLNHINTFDNYAYFIAQTSSSIMYDLAYCNQIDPSYLYDTEKRIRHAYLLADKNSCWFNNLKQTGSLYIALPGVYRLLCNGALDYFDSMEHIKYLVQIQQNELEATEGGGKFNE